MLPPLKIISKTEKQKKNKAILTGRTGVKTKRKRNKSRRVVGQHHKLGEANFCPAIMPQAFGGKKEYPLETGEFGSGFVHVFDEQSTFTVLNELDTITDFVNYFKA